MVTCQSLIPFKRRISHKHSLPKKLAVHRVLYPSMLTESWVEGKSVEEKDAQPTERTAALWGLSSKINSRIWVKFTRNGLRLGLRHQESPHTDVSRNLARVVVRGVLPGLRRITGLLPTGPKSFFQIRASFVFHLETKVLESGGREEKLIAQVSWSPVLSFHSLWWFGVQCHLLVLVHCVFLKTNVTAPIYQEMLEHCMLPSADQLFKDADFIFQQDSAPAHIAKRTKSWLNDQCAWLASKLSRFEPHRDSVGYCQEENEKRCYETGPGLASSHHQRSSSPILPDSFTLTPHTCARTHTHSCCPSWWPI